MANKGFCTEWQQVYPKYVVQPNTFWTDHNITHLLSVHTAGCWAIHCFEYCCGMCDCTASVFCSICDFGIPRK